MSSNIFSNIYVAGGIYAQSGLSVTPSLSVSGTSNLTTLNVSSSAYTTSLNVATTANVTTLSVTGASNLNTLNVTGTSNLSTLVSTGQIQSLDSVRGHALPSDALIFASGTQVNPQNQNLGNYAIVESSGGVSGNPTINVVAAVTQSPFADLYKEGSMYFPGATTSNIYASLGSSYSIGNGLTAECWVNYSSFTGSTLNTGAGATSVYNPCALGAFTGGAGSCAWALGADTNGKLLFYYYSSSAGNQSANTNASLSLNTWNHIAVSIPSSGPISLYINGVQQTSNANNGGSLSAPSASTVALNGTTGSYGYLGLGAVYYSSVSAYTTGYIADARVVYGTALYTGSSFTVPSAPLSPSATGSNALLLRVGANAPTLQSGALTFDRGIKSFMNFGPQTFNIVTQGFTAVWRGAFYGTVSAYERLFEFGPVNTSTGGSIAVIRGNVANNLIFYIFPTNSSTQYYVTTTNFLTQGINYVIAFRYNPSTQIADVWVNGVLNTSGTITTAQIVADRTVAFTYLSQASDGSKNGQYTSNTLAIYNRALSNTEIYNSYLALSTVPQTPQNSTLEIGDVNGTPALRITGDGRVNMTKLGQTSNVVPWPPAAMTSYVTSLNGQTYVASASSESGGLYAWYVFDKSTSGYWGSGSVSYSTSTGIYSGSITTTDVNGTVYPGEWIQIQTPSQVLLTSYVFTFYSSAYGASNWVILGSRDGVNWSLMNSQAGQVVTGGPPANPLTYSVAQVQSYTYYRAVFTKSYGASAGNINVYEWTLYGTADTAQTLTVAQPVTLSYGAQTSSLVGIPNPGVYAPQDFSSSALNIPAYVVSNTATVANTVQYSEFGPFAGEGSLYFPGGAGAYVNFGTNVNGLWPGGGALTDGTIEMWVYLAKYNASNTILAIREAGLGGSTLDWYFYVTNAGVLGFYMTTSVTNYTASGGTVPLNTWNHVAFTMKSGFMSVFLNGVAGGTTTTATGTIANAASDNLVIGNYQGNSGYTINGYISNMRLTAGLALYTTSFVPPTAPLQPLQGTTQAGLPYGTVLLLRNAPAPGRVLTSKFGGQNSSAVLPFPPAAMTGYSTALSSGYGQGTYVASASNEFDSSTNTLWHCFDKSTSTIWTGDGSSYTSGNYVKSPPVTTVDVNGNSYQGEWIQIQMPSSTILSTYQINAPATQGPALFYLLGSRDGVNWYLVDSRSGQVPNSTYLTYSVSSGQAFTYFRIVTNKIAGGSSYVQIYEIILNGSIEGPTVSADGRLGVGVSAPVQQLEVAGSAVVAGTLSAGNPLMFRNRIINGDMRIWQRGTTFSSVSASTYTADRWCTGGNAQSLTVAQSIDTPLYGGFQNSISVTSTFTSGSTALLEQRLERVNSLDFYKGTPFVISFWAKQTAGTANGLNVSPLFPSGVETGYNAGTNASSPVVQTATLSSSWTYYTMPFVISSSSVATNGLYFQIYWSNGSPSNPSTVLITGVQLEKGTIATPFEVRPYATELALCQRYYISAGQTASGTTGVALGRTFNTGASAATLAVNYNFPVTMRTTPSSWTLYYDINDGTITAQTYSGLGSAWAVELGVASVPAGGFLDLDAALVNAEL